MDVLAEALQPWFAGLIDVALAGMFGAAILLGGADGFRTVRFARVSMALLGVGLLACLWAGTMVMSGAAFGETPAALGTVLLQTSFGSMILAAGLGWLVLAATVFARRLEQAGKLRRAFIWLGLVWFALARAATGHAMDHGWASYAVWIHALHIMSGAAWAGTAALAAYLALSWQDWMPARRVALAHRVSRAATLALVVVAASGVANTLRMFGAAGIAWEAPYTWVLLGKLAGVALAVCMGAYNRWRVMPCLEKNEMPGAGRRFGAILLAESAVMLIVMLLAARLGSMMPPDM